MFYCEPQVQLKDADSYKYSGGFKGGREGGGGGGGVQMHAPLVAGNVFLRTYLVLHLGNSTA